MKKNSDNKCIPDSFIPMNQRVLIYRNGKYLKRGSKRWHEKSLKSSLKNRETSWKELDTLQFSQIYTTIDVTLQNVNQNVAQNVRLCSHSFQCVTAPKTFGLQHVHRTVSSLLFLQSHQKREKCFMKCYINSTEIFNFRSKFSSEKREVLVEATQQTSDNSFDIRPTQIMEMGVQMLITNRS